MHEMTLGQTISNGSPSGMMGDKQCWCLIIFLFAPLLLLEVYDREYTCFLGWTWAVGLLKNLPENLQSKIVSNFNGIRTHGRSLLFYLMQDNCLLFNRLICFRLFKL